MSAPTHVVTLPMDGCECFRCQQLRMAQLTPVKAFEAEAVQTAQRTAERFQQRLADEQSMADTVAVHSDNEVRQLNRMIDTLEGENERLKKDRDVLVKRIEALEATRPVFVEAKETIDRIAYVLRTFYYAELSMSSVQPLLALCLELNPEIVEQKR